MVKNPPANAGDLVSFYPWVRKIPGEGNGNPLQYFCLENPMERGLQSMGLQKNWTQHSDLTTTTGIRNWITRCAMRAEDPGLTVYFLPCGTLLPVAEGILVLKGQKYRVRICDGLLHLFTPLTHQPVTPSSLISRGTWVSFPFRPCTPPHLPPP